jgi:hypothetical protein
MKRTGVSACLALAAVTLIAACSTTNGNPSSPAPPTTAGVQSIIVTSSATSSSTFQMAARAAMADGTSRDVTTQAAWDTSNASLATISPTGVLTARGSGQVEVRATFQDKTGSVSVAVSAPPKGPSVMLFGDVSETPPTPKVLPGTTIQITAGPDSGLSVVTDANGRFRFSAQTATIAVEARKDGYLLWRLSNLILDHDQPLYVALYPIPPTDPIGVSATARCADGSWSWATTRATACTANGGVAYTVCPGPICEASVSHRTGR